jgi:Domain of unknown function (DUF305)
MPLFSRAFIRKRLISLATTASVTATSLALAQGPTRTHHAGRALPIQYVADRTFQSEEQPFLSENAAVMNKMVRDVSIKPTGDVDPGFVEMMVPHYLGAIDMAKAELKYGHNKQLRELVQEMVANQQQKITMMRNAFGSERSSTAQPPKQPRMELSPQSIPPAGAVAHGRMKMSQ